MSVETFAKSESEIRADAFVSELLALTSRAAQRRYLLQRKAQLTDDVLKRMHRETQSGLGTGELGRSLQIVHLMEVAASLTGSQEHRARGFAARADILCLGEGKYRRALDAFDRALALHRQRGVVIDEAKTQVGRVWALINSGRGAEALADGEWTLGVFREAGLVSQAADAAHVLAVIHDKLGNDEQAMALFDEELRLLNLLDPEDHASDIALARANRALVLRGQGRFSDACREFQEGADGLLRSGNIIEAARARQNLGVTYLHLGRYHEGLRLLESARKVFVADGRHRHAGRLDLYVAEYMLALRRFEEALSHCRAAHKVFAHTSGPFDMAQADLLEGDALLGSGDADGALVAFARAEQQFVIAGNNFWAIWTGVRTARALLAQGSIDACLEEAEVTARKLADLGAVGPQVEALLQAAEAQRRNGDCAAALQTLDRAESLLGRQGTPWQTYQLGRLRGALLHRTGDSAAALSNLEAAMKAMEHMLGHMMAEYRMGFIEDKDAVFQEAVSLALSRGDCASALGYAERARSRVLSDLVAGRVEMKLRPRKDEDQQLVERFNADLQKRDTLLRRLGELDAEREGGDDAALNLRQDAMARLAELETAVAANWNQLLERNADYAIGQLRWTDRHQMLGVQLPDDTVLVEYYLGSDVGTIFTVRGDGIEAARVSLPAARVHELLDYLSLTLRSARGKGPSVKFAASLRAQKQLQALYALCWAPIADRVGDSRRVTIVPHGVLHYVPFQALHDGKQYLIERHEVTYLPSAELANRAPTTSHSAGDQALVLGHSQGGKLPHCTIEAQAIASVLGCKPLIDSEATVAAMIDRAPACDVVHIAAHGEFWAANPLFSGIALDDGWLKTVDIFSRLELNASLVTLSACHSGRSRVAGGDELLGLTRAFLAAGARSLVLSLWVADDQATYELMLSFYRHLADGLSKAAALRAAQMERIAVERDSGNGADSVAGVLDWAPFVLVGDPGAL